MDVRLIAVGFAVAAVLVPAGLETSAAPPLYVQVQLFKSGEHGYHTYRIPALAASKKGRLLAFVEGRKSGRSDTGDIDVLLRRSFDNGKTWTEAQVVADHGDDTIGNPCPVVDAGTRTIWLLLTGNPGKTNETQILDDAGQGTRTVWVTHSNDDGATWAAPIEITSSVKEKNWTWYATGPGNGIQLESGRLLVPCDHARQGSHKIYSHVIYSDDHGRTWRIGGTVGEDTDECQVVELQDGTLLVNMRSNQGKNRRALSRSRDGGLSWSPIEFDETLIEPVCQASFIRYTRKGKSATRSRLLFSNPAGVKRVNLTIRLSYDDGATWPVSKLLHEGPSAYSSMAVLKDSSVACLNEQGESHPYETVTFARFNLEWLTDGRDKHR